jgi:hypothetical protein
MLLTTFRRTPSEVNGWKEIYKARAAQAEKGKKVRANLADRAWKYAEVACKTESESATKLRKLEREKRRLKLASG